MSRRPMIFLDSPLEVVGDQLLVNHPVSAPTSSAKVETPPADDHKPPALDVKLQVYQRILNIRPAVSSAVRALARGATGAVNHAVQLPPRKKRAAGAIFIALLIFVSIVYILLSTPIDTKMRIVQTASAAVADIVAGASEKSDKVDVVAANTDASQCSSLEQNSRSGLHHQLMSLAEVLAVNCSSFGPTPLPAFTADLPEYTLAPLPFSDVFSVASLQKGLAGLCKVAAGPSSSFAGEVLGLVEGCGDATEARGDGVGPAAPALAAAAPRASSSVSRVSVAALPYRSLVYRSLRLAPALEETLFRCEKMRNERWGGPGKPFVAVHIRMEADWLPRCQLIESSLPPGTRACVSPRDVVEAVRKQLGKDHPARARILLVGDYTLAKPPQPGAAADPLSAELWGDDVRVFSAHGPNGCFATDRASVEPLSRTQVRQGLCAGGPRGCGSVDAGSSRRRLTVTDRLPPPCLLQRAAVDSFLAARADVFIGTAASAFSYGVAMLRAVNNAGVLVQARGAPPVPERVPGQPMAYSYFCVPRSARLLRLLPWESAHVLQRVILENQPPQLQQSKQRAARLPPLTRLFACIS
jgi:hypothetical protein